MTAVPEQLSTALEDTYRLTRELGRGATRFGREIEIAARLTHPHILMLIRERGA